MARTLWRLIHDQHDQWFMIQVGEEDEFEKWCYGQIVGKDFTDYMVDGPESVMIHGWHEKTRTLIVTE